MRQKLNMEVFECYCGNTNKGRSGDWWSSHHHHWWTIIMAKAPMFSSTSYTSDFFFCVSHVLPLRSSFGQRHSHWSSLDIFFFFFWWNKWVKQEDVCVCQTMITSLFSLLGRWCDGGRRQSCKERHVLLNSWSAAGLGCCSGGLSVGVGGLLRPFQEYNLLESGTSSDPDWSLLLKADPCFFFFSVFLV